MGRETLHENLPLSTLGCCFKADSLPLIPKLVQFSTFIVFCSFFFLAKLNLSYHRNQTCVLSEAIFHQDAHADVTRRFLRDLLFTRLVMLCGDPLPELSSDIPSTHKKNKNKKNTWKVTSLAYFCLVFDISQRGMSQCHYMGAYRCMCVRVCVHDVSVQVHKV